MKSSLPLILSRALWRVPRQPLLVYTLMLIEVVPPLLLFLLARVGLGGGQRVTGFLLGAVPLVLLVVGPWFSAGTMGLFRAATMGFHAGAQAFLEGTRRYYVRALAGVTGLALASVALGIPVAALSGSQANAPLVPLSGTAGLAGLMAHPALWLYAAPTLLITFLLTYWSPAVALEDRNASLGVLASLRMVMRQLPATLILALLNTFISYQVAALTGSPSWNGLQLAGGSIVAHLALQPTGRVASEILFAGMLLGLWQAFYRLALYELYAAESPWVKRETARPVAGVSGE